MVPASKPRVEDESERQRIEEGERRRRGRVRPTPHPGERIDVDNPGGMIMTSMGWTQGNGLGPTGRQGITVPIKAHLQVAKSGVGFKGMASAAATFALIPDPDPWGVPRCGGSSVHKPVQNSKVNVRRRVRAININGHSNTINVSGHGGGGRPKGTPRRPVTVNVVFETGATSGRSEGTPGTCEGEGPPENKEDEDSAQEEDDDDEDDEEDEGEAFDTADEDDVDEGGPDDSGGSSQGWSAGPEDDDGGGSSQEWSAGPEGDDGGGDVGGSAPTADGVGRADAVVLTDTGGGTGGAHEPTAISDDDHASSRSVVGTPASRRPLLTRSRTSPAEGSSLGGWHAIGGPTSNHPPSVDTPARHGRSRDLGHCDTEGYTASSGPTPRDEPDTSIEHKRAHTSITDPFDNASYLSLSQVDCASDEPGGVRSRALALVEEVVGHPSTIPATLEAVHGDRNGLLGLTHPSQLPAVVVHESKSSEGLDNPPTATDGIMMRPNTSPKLVGERRPARRPLNRGSYLSSTRAEHNALAHAHGGELGETQLRPGLCGLQASTQPAHKTPFHCNITPIHIGVALPKPAHAP